MKTVETPEPSTKIAGPSEKSAGVSIVIPAYNEAAGVGITLPELTQFMDGLESEIPWEIVVVDDGSSDGTAEAIKPFVGPRLRLISHDENRGYGAALKTGIHSAIYPWILITDADGTYPCRHIPELLEQRADFEMVIGARIGQDAHIPLIRKPAKWTLQVLASYLSRQKIVDLNSGMRTFPRELAERFANLMPDGFSFTSTITLALLSAGYRLKYIPIEYRVREGRSKIRPIPDTLNFLRLIVRTIMFFDPMRVLLPVSLGFMLSSLGVAVGSIVFTDHFMDVTTVLLFVTGVQLLALGMIADVINRRLP
ncbi:MAG: glycosyltransferase family 2 protein [bacterium]|nr:glycosyltransferase family 2 protein [bacterium]